MLKDSSFLHKTTKRFSNFDTSIYHIQGRCILEAKTPTPNNISSAMRSVRSVSHCISTGIRHLLQFFLQVTLVGTVRNINFYSLYINQHVENRHTKNSTNHQKCCAFSIFSFFFLNFFFFFYFFKQLKWDGEITSQVFYKSITFWWRLEIK